MFRKPGTTEKAMGVQITWEAPDTPVTRYGIYRGISSNGIMKDPTPVQDGQETPVRVLSGEKPIIMKSIPGKAHYRYTDFKVEDNKTYYYKVYSMIGDDFFTDNPVLEGMKSPIATSTLSATPRNCILTSELAKYTLLGINGEFVDFIDLKSDWQALSVRKLLGKELDIVFSKIDALADRIAGMVNTGSSATSSFIDFYANKVTKLLELVTEFSDIINRLLAFNMRGTFMLLRLPLAEGGMEGFVNRFNKASSMGSSEAGSNQAGAQNTPGNSVAVIDQGGGIAQYREKGIMFGVILLFGIPTPSVERLREIVDPSEVKALQAKLKMTEKAITTLLKLLGLG
jgi:hypothetical protein